MTNKGETVEASADASLTSGANGYYTTNFGWHCNAWIEFDHPQDMSVTATVHEAGGVAANPCDQKCTPRAFNAWIFRNPDPANPANAGGLFHHDVWWGNGTLAGLSGLTTATSTIPIPPALVERDVIVEFALSDLEGDGNDRSATVTVAANGQSVTRIYTNVDLPECLGDELLIGSLALPLVPKNISSVDVTFTSDVGANPLAPHLSGGDSFFGSGAAVSVGPIDLTFGRFTGGFNHYNDNQLGTFNVTGGLTLHCDITLSNNLEINWNDGTQHRWHIEKESLVEESVVCRDDPEIEQRPPRAPLDTFTAEAIGSLTYGDNIKNEDGSIIHFTIVDAGEPGRDDMIDFKIWAPGDDPVVDAPVLNVAGYLQRGANLQAHYDQPHGNKPPKP